LELEDAKHRYVDPAWIAHLYSDLDEKDQAFVWLDKAYAEKSDVLSFLKVSPWFANLRSDPRYAAMLKKMGLPQ
jgi:hypothetical protein